MGVHLSLSFLSVEVSQDRVFLCSKIRPIFFKKIAAKNTQKGIWNVFLWVWIYLMDGLGMRKEVDINKAKEAQIYMFECYKEMKVEDKY